MPWNPAQYNRFRTERAQPFWDLLGLVTFRPGMRIVDLGCGTGELTAKLAALPQGGHTLGIDSSAEMLERAAPLSTPALEFRQADIAAFEPDSPLDLLFSNAALQWLPDHEALFPRLISMLAPGGQIAVQMPMNHEAPSHRVAHELARHPDFASDLQGFVRRPDPLPAEFYAELLYRSGATSQQVFEKVYGHVLDSLEEVVEWVKGTLLLPYLERLPPSRHAYFLEAYRQGLRREMGDASPVFFPFRRLLMAATFP